jgi:Ran GTPase-activating protein (RanGAP) involved in mRNA processing and transport
VDNADNKFSKNQNRAINLNDLNLSDNNFTDTTIVPLMFNLHSNTELVTLNLAHNYVEEASGTVIYKVLEFNIALCNLDITGAKLA